MNADIYAEYGYDRVYNQSLEMYNLMLEQWHWHGNYDEEFRREMLDLGVDMDQFDGNTSKEDLKLDVYASYGWDTMLKLADALRNYHALYKLDNINAENETAFTVSGRLINILSDLSFDGEPGQHTSPIIGATGALEFSKTAK